MSPDLLLSLANLTVERRPVRGQPAGPGSDPLATAGGAAQALDLAEVTASELPRLRELHDVVVALVDRLLGGEQVDEPAARLTALAQASHAHARLGSAEPGRLHGRLEWSDQTMVGGLARRVVLELSALDVGRLRRCARPECRLLFYDSTRSNTRLWHAEAPCGRRERQRRHRTAQRCATERAQAAE